MAWSDGQTADDGKGNPKARSTPMVKLQIRSQSRMRGDYLFYEEKLEATQEERDLKAARRYGYFCSFFCFWSSYLEHLKRTTYSRPTLRPSTDQSAPRSAVEAKWPYETNVLNASVPAWCQHTSEMAHRCLFLGMVDPHVTTFPSHPLYHLSPGK